MSFFESKEEKMRREKKMQEEVERLNEQRNQEEKRRQEEEALKMRNDFLKELQEIAKSQDVIAITVYDTSLKEIAIRFLISQGFICVQNDAAATKYTVYYILTFAKKEIAVNFK